MDVSKLTAKNQVTVPADVRTHLGVKSGDHVAFAVEDGKVVVRKARPIDWEWARAIEPTLQEWVNEENNRAWAYLDEQP